MCTLHELQLQSNLTPHFRCPISLELMKDPVTLSTGITYDRESIERWFGDGHRSCPVTMQALDVVEFTPNDTLRRIIRSLFVESGLDMARAHSLPRMLSNSTMQISRILDDLASNIEVLDRLKVLKSAAKECTSDRRSNLLAGADLIVASLLSSNSLQALNNKELKAIEICSEAVATLSLLSFCKETKIVLTSPQVLEYLAGILSQEETVSTIQAATILRNLATDEHMPEVIGETEGVITGLLKLARQASNNTGARRISISTLVSLLGIERNRIRSVKVGAVAILIELLPDTGDGELCRRIFAALNLLLSCPEGCGAAIDHALAVPAIVKKILRVPEEATAHALEALWKICKFTSNRSIFVEAVEVGALEKMILVLQIEICPSIKQKARELLKVLVTSVPSIPICEMHYTSNNKRVRLPRK